MLYLGHVRWVASHAGSAWVVGFGAYIAVALGATFPLPGSRTRSRLRCSSRPSFPLAAVLIVLPVALEPAGGGLRRVLRSAPFVAVGTISYGIYLWHLTVIRWTQDWIAQGEIPRSAVLQATLVLGITGAIATLSYLVVERPLMRWSARLTRRPRVVGGALVAGVTSPAPSPSCGNSQRATTSAPASERCTPSVRMATPSMYVGEAAGWGTTREQVDDLDAARGCRAATCRMTAFAALTRLTSNAPAEELVRRAGRRERGDARDRGEDDLGAVVGRGP